MKFLYFWLLLLTIAIPLNPAGAIFESIFKGVGNIGKKAAPQVGKEVVENVPNRISGLGQGIGKIGSTFGNGAKKVGQSLGKIGSQIGNGFQKVKQGFWNFFRRKPTKVVPVNPSAFETIPPPKLPVFTNELVPIPRQTIQLPKPDLATSIIRAGVRVPIQGFFLAAVKNPSGAAPIMKAIARGATMTALENPRLMVKLMTDVVIPKIFQASVSAVGRLFSSIKTFAVGLLGFTVKTVSKPVTKLTAAQVLREKIANGLFKVGEDIAVINQALVTHAIGIGMRIGAKNDMALDAAELLGKKAMKTFISDPKKFDDPLLINFLIKFQKENPIVFGTLFKAQTAGVLEVIGAFLERSRRNFMNWVSSFTSGLRKRNLYEIEQKELDEIEKKIKEILDQYDALEAAIANLKKQSEL